MDTRPTYSDKLAFVEHDRRAEHVPDETAPPSARTAPAGTGRHCFARRAGLRGNRLSPPRIREQGDVRGARDGNGGQRNARAHRRGGIESARIPADRRSDVSQAVQGGAAENRPDVRAPARAHQRQRHRGDDRPRRPVERADRQEAERARIDARIERAQRPRGGVPVDRHRARPAPDGGDPQPGAKHPRRVERIVAQAGARAGRRTSNSAASAC